MSPLRVLASIVLGVLAGLVFLRSYVGNATWYERNKLDEPADFLAHARDVR